MGSIFYDIERKDDETEKSYKINNNTIINFTCLQTVKENKNFLTKEKIARASKARRYQSILCWPFTTSYINIVDNNMITNGDINLDDRKRANIIWGPAEYVLQEKMK